MFEKEMDRQRILFRDEIQAQRSEFRQEIQREREFFNSHLDRLTIAVDRLEATLNGARFDGHSI
jgi:hypothetical protein